MKKMTSLLLAFAVSVLVFASSAMAYEKAGTGELQMGVPAMKPIGLSPKVYGIYYTNGTDAGTAQWFAIGTAHPGGNEMYATAQNLTNNYKKTFTAGTTINSALFALPASPNSADAWTDALWLP